MLSLSVLMEDLTKDLTKNEQKVMLEYIIQHSLRFSYCGLREKKKRWNEHLFCTCVHKIDRKKMSWTFETACLTGWWSWQAMTDRINELKRETARVLSPAISSGLTQWRNINKSLTVQTGIWLQSWLSFHIIIFSGIMYICSRKRLSDGFGRMQVFTIFENVHQFHKWTPPGPLKILYI